MPDKPIKPNSTQAHLPFVGVEDGIVIMPDGSYRAVLAVGATNFSLKSQQEQEAIIVTYQNFLNSLNYSIQIVMQSRTLDLEPYLKKLEDGIPNQRNDLIKQQTADYAAYMRELITAANIMDKRFYVVIPYSPIQVSKQSFFSSLFPKGNPGPIKIDQKQFEAHRDELKQRAGIIGSGLSTMGLKVTALETDDVIRLFYNCYNIDLAAEERVDDPMMMTGNIIESEAEEESLTGKKSENIEQRSDAAGVAKVTEGSEQRAVSSEQAEGSKVQGADETQKIEEAKTVANMPQPSPVAPPVTPATKPLPPLPTTTINQTPIAIGSQNTPDQPDANINNIP
jgi:hypothetical protein